MSSPLKKNLLLWGTILILTVLVGAGIVYYLSFHSRLAQPSKTPQESVSPQEMQEFLQKRGEAAFKKQRAEALIAIYEKMLPQYPDNIDLKKKLADAYRDAGREEEAEKLLKELQE